MTLTKVKLTDEQNAAMATLAALRKPIQTLGGLAGTGKTTVIRELVQRLSKPKVCAYTGKAAQVLRKKGVDASTIHSLIYYYSDPNEGGSGEFELQPSLDCDVVIVDEASMVGKPIYDDLCSFGIPLIFVGDHGQLEPVGSDSFNLMVKPDLTLEKIHRNAGEIAMFANHLRQGKEARDWRWDEDKEGEESRVHIITSDELEQVALDEVDQVICAFNNTRVGVNKTYREHLGFGPSPQVGDRIMCLQNDRKSKVFNGMQGELVEINSYMLTMLSNGIKFKCYYTKSGFNSETKPAYQRGVIPFDYAYCVTAHKAQGDEWNHVLVMEQKCSKWDHRRWAYTAASRAKQKLTWVLQ